MRSVSTNKYLIIKKAKLFFGQSALEKEKDKGRSLFGQSALWTESP